MKRFVVICILAVFIPMFAFAQSAVTIDTALRNSTQYLNTRIPAKTKVVVLNFTSDWPKLSDYIIEELIGYIVNDGEFAVVDRANLESIRKELNFQLSGDVSDETAQSIGKMLGAQTIISGSITTIGSAYRLRIRAISVESAQIVGMQNVDVAQDARLAALTGTAYVAGTSTTTTTARPATTTTTSTPATTAPSGFIVIPAAWINNSGQGNATVNMSVGRENIGGQDRDVLTVDVSINKGSGFKYGQVLMEDRTAMQQLRKATGVRFKALGDGKSWLLGFATDETKVDHCHYQATIATKKGSVVVIDIPLSKLKQPTWGKKQTFYKNNLDFLVLQHPNDNAAASTASIKVFDFEIY
ncbi:MAG: CIA30 family protein [Treponema sp.]|jgi:curli biogenesis system outer membrane secretion channel CsgG|nr:CIA30 family protein [Treponema sp.]